MKCPLNCSYNRSTTICSIPFPEAQSGLKLFCEEAAFYTAGCHSGEGPAWKQCSVVRTVALFLARLGEPWWGNSLGIWNQRWCGVPPTPSAWRRERNGRWAKTEVWRKIVCIWWGVGGRYMAKCFILPWLFFFCFTFLRDLFMLGPTRLCSLYSNGTWTPTLYFLTMSAVWSTMACKLLSDSEMGFYRLMGLTEQMISVAMMILSLNPENLHIPKGLGIREINR